jgi:hypothetical protein
MLNKTQKVELFDEYSSKISMLRPLAEKAVGSRATSSVIHDISAGYTSLLVEYADKGGSIPMMAKELGVTYAALRRRITTASLAPLPRAGRSKATPAQYAQAAIYVREQKANGTEAYHDSIKQVYYRGVGLITLATYMGLKSAYPLYYGLNKARMRAEGK